MKRLIILLTLLGVAIAGLLAPATAAPTNGPYGGHQYPTFTEPDHCQTKTFHYSTGSLGSTKICITNNRWRVQDDGDGLVWNEATFTLSNCGAYKQVGLTGSDAVVLSPNGDYDGVNLGFEPCPSGYGRAILLKASDHDSSANGLNHVSADMKGGETIHAVFSYDVCARKTRGYSTC